MANVIEKTKWRGKDVIWNVPNTPRRYSPDDIRNMSDKEYKKFRKEVGIVDIDVQIRHSLIDGSVIDIPHAWRAKKLMESHEMRKLSHADLASVYVNEMLWDTSGSYEYYRDLFVQTGDYLYMDKMLEKVEMYD